LHIDIELNMVAWNGKIGHKCHGILQPRSSLGISVGELTWKWKLRQVPDDVGIVDGLRCHRALIGRWWWLDERHVWHVQLLLLHLMSRLDLRQEKIRWRD
jgi:hypothetical protein